jgi:Ca2+-binding EF-hand superfamily protein
MPSAWGDQGLWAEPIAAKLVVMERHEGIIVAKKDPAFEDLFGFDVGVFQEVKSRYLAINRELQGKSDSKTAELRYKFIEKEVERWRAGEAFAPDVVKSGSAASDEDLGAWVYKLSPKLRAEIPIETLAHLQAKFLECDTDGNGTIDSKEFYVMCSEEFGQNKAEIDRAFKRWDHDSDGILNFEEFVKSVLPLVYADHRYWEKDGLGAEKIEEDPNKGTELTRRGYRIDIKLKKQTPPRILRLIDKRFAELDSDKR